MENKFVVAISLKEAQELVDVIGHDTREEADAHLAEVKAPPTDPYYANQYKVYEVVATPAELNHVHMYISTACVHQRHTECRLKCKFCEHPCACACHQATPSAQPGDGKSGEAGE